MRDTLNKSRRFLNPELESLLAATTFEPFKCYAWLKRTLKLPFPVLLQHIVLFAATQTY